MCEVTFLCCFSGVEGLAGLGDQLVSQMSYPENLKIHNPDSAGVECIPLKEHHQFQRIMWFVY